MDGIKVAILWVFLIGLINEIQSIVIIGQNTTCTDRDWTCRSKDCIKKSQICDGTKNCADGSDETAEACIHHQCPSFAFQCAYGGCIDAVGECNGSPECADSSDEFSAKCAGDKEHRGNCAAGNFECSSGECIPKASRCNGKLDCQDGSDEIVQFCASQVCPANSFRCGYGACIDEHKKCNNVRDCADGSDEVSILCGGTSHQTEAPPTRSSAQQCEVGDWPNTIVSYAGNSNDRIQAGEFVNEYGNINIDCPQGFTRFGPRENVCVYGRWGSQPIPTCERTCKPIINGISFEAKCSYNHASVECSDSQRPGTQAAYSCKVGYSQPDAAIPQNIAVCHKNGEWDYQLYACVPICGVEPIEKATFASGSKINNTYVPWSIAIYTQREELNPRKIGDFRHICGGTIVNTRVVISAAHCFWNTERNEKEDKSSYEVLAGKYYRSYSASEPLGIQRFKLEDLIIFDEYHHVHGNYEADIAVLILERDVIYQNHIKPICTDVSGADRELAIDTLGRTAGFGHIDERGTPTVELRVAELQVVNRSLCNVKEGMVYKYTTTRDKICIKGQQSDAVCNGDSGGGFAVPKEESHLKKYYLYGVVSHSAAGTNFCNDNSYVAFTNIQDYMPQLRNYILRFRSL